jgi:hypothetical protein
MSYPLCPLSAQVTNSVTNPTFDFVENEFHLNKNESTTNWFFLWHQSFDHKARIVFSDSFGWQSDLSWLRRYDQSQYINTDYAHSGKQAFRKAGLYSFREAVVQLPGVFESKNWLSEFFANSIGKTTEQSINTSSGTTIAAQQSWWQEMRHDGSIVYGTHFFDGDFLYGSFRFGHWNDTPVGIVLARVHGDPTSLRSTADGQCTFFLPWSCALVAGVSYQLSDIHRVSQPLHWSITLMHIPLNITHETVELLASVSGGDNGTLTSIELHKSF